MDDLATHGHVMPSLLSRPRTRSSLAAARRLLAEADGLLIGAGAGMSAESGLGTYRGPGGTWRSKEVDAEGLTRRQRASAEALRTHRDSTLDVYARRWRDAQDAVPHAGYRLLLETYRTRPAGAFVYTSNVDGLFRRVGFAEEHVYEAHGTLATSQCLAACGASLWPTPPSGPSVCPSCGERGRPNMLLFDDFEFDGTRKDEQWQAWGRWLTERSDAKLVAVEVGAGTAIPTIRNRSESFAARGWPLIRVNLTEASVPGSVAERSVEVRLGAVEALTRLLG